MKVRALGHFKHGRFLAEPGKVYDVPDRIGGRWTGNGWAEELPDDAAADATPDLGEFAADAPAGAPAEKVTLAVDDVSHSVG